jgi:glycyl-tRNA synthetase (class II)
MHLFCRFNKAETELLVKYKERVSPYFGEEELAEIVKMPARSRYELIQEFDEVIEALEKDWFNESYYDYGTRVIKELVKKGGLAIKEIKKGITEYVDEKGSLSYRGILLLFMAGEMQIETSFHKWSISSGMKRMAMWH